MSEKTPPLTGMVYEAVPEAELTEYNWAEGRQFTHEIDDAMLITSMIRDSNMHKVAIDVDLPISVVPSSTPGHGHLYIDKELTWPQYEKLLHALAEAGIVEEGYVGASVRRGYTSLRLPWVSKADLPSPRCFRCGKTPDQVGLYAQLAEEEGMLNADAYVRREEGTYSRKYNTFACDKCYIEIGMPSSPFGWVAGPLEVD